jgi:FAD synthase
MKTFKDLKKDLFEGYITEAKNGKAVLTFGRFNPLTKGHQELVNFVVDLAKKKGAEAMIYPSQSQDAKKNPLTFDDKVKFMKKFFPKANIIKDPSLKNVFSILKELSNKGYKDVTLVVGADRTEEFDSKIKPYIKHADPAKSYDFDSFKVINSGERKTGISGTDMRNHAKDNDFDSFKKGLPTTATDKDAKDIFDAVRKGMKLV